MQNYLIHLLVSYKYVFLIPVAFVEGHVISLIAGFLSKLGYLNLIISWACISIGNLLGDVCLYWLGFYKGDSLVRKWGKYVGFKEVHLKKAKEIFHAHKNSILFTSKISNGFGMAIPILFVAGSSQIPFGVFMAWNILGESIWTGAMVLLGYTFGSAYVSIGSILTRIGVIVPLFVFLFFVLFKIKQYFKNRIL